LNNGACCKHAPQPARSSSCNLKKYNIYLEQPLNQSGGRLKLSSAPGLGITLAMDYMRANVIDGFGGS
jgi:galactonate dehydratase